MAPHGARPAIKSVVLETSKRTAGNADGSPGNYGQVSDGFDPKVALKP